MNKTEEKTELNINSEVVKRRTRGINGMFVLTFIYIVILIVAVFVKYDVSIEFKSKFLKKFSNVDTEISLLTYGSLITKSKALSGVKLYGLIVGIFLITLVLDGILTRFVYQRFNKGNKLLAKQDKRTLKDGRNKLKLKKLERKRDETL